jgi:hypothetical protein
MEGVCGLFLCATPSVSSRGLVTLPSPTWISNNVKELKDVFDKANQNEQNHLGIR